MHHPRGKGLTRLLLIRHGPTEWNEARRLQGQADPGLSPRGRAEVLSWRLPPDWKEACWLSSPLRRARETAALLTAAPVAIEPRLIEMDWGAFEGRTLADLRADDPAGMAVNEARGLDFRPPGGESPREVAERFRKLAAELSETPGPAIAVAHKGVVRAALALATGWDMTTRPPLRLAGKHARALLCHPRGRIEPAGPPLALAE
jgi:probable phosphoglycerate mutase